MLRDVLDLRTFTLTDSELERLGTSGGWMTDGSPDKLNQDHDSLISDYNRMRL